MMQTDPRQIRQTNFQRVVKHFGLSKVVDITGRQRSQISDCAAGRRTIGEKLARRLESELSLDPGSLDLPEVKGEGLEIVTTGQHRIPLLSWSGIVSSGTAAPLDVLLSSMDLSKSAFAVEISDGSMAPTFNPGDHVIIDPETPPAPGDYVVAVTDDGAVFRRYRKLSSTEFLLMPTNEDFPVVSSSDTTKIIGVMVEHRIYRK